MIAKGQGSRLGRNIGFQYLLQIAKYLFPFITIPYLTRVLGPEVYAIRAYVLAAMTFAQVFLDYGFNSYGTREIAQNKDDMQKVRRETYTIVELRVVLCVVCAVAIAFVTQYIPIMRDNPEYVAIAYICICFKAMLPDFVFQGFEEMAIITYRFVASQAIATILVFVLVHSATDLLWVPALEALAAGIAFIWSWQNVIMSRDIKPLKPTMTGLRIAMKTSTVFFLSNASTAIFTSLTTLMIGILISDQSQVSYWAIAMTAIQAIQALYLPITNSLYPHMCAQQDFSIVKRFFVVGVPAVALGTLLFFSLADYVMLILGGEEYVEGSYIVALVSPVLFFSFPAMLLGFPVLAAVGCERQLTASSMVASLFHIIGLGVLAASGLFLIEYVCVLRCFTEALLFLLRFASVWRYYRGNQVSRPS